MSAQKNRGILKDKSFQSLGVSKTTSFNEISLMNTTERAVRPEMYMDHDPKSARTSINSLSATSLAEELKRVSESNKFNFDIDTEDDSSDDEYLVSETLLERVQRLEFERRRSLHYTEFRTVQLARRLIAEEFSTSSETVESEHVRSFKSSSCDAEECPSAESKESVGNKSLEQMIAEKLFLETQLADQDAEPEPEVELEQGFSPSHPCYHKLTAKDTALPQQERTSKSNIVPI
ncbi:protein phosphatase inhibitor 2-like [Drosophila pseudoobscura]|uniref:Protein phosphatase inhibitor 2-like n=1 Tax=Drosophila pseudoobscura pseudoobscura TaxID=46245 RepID=A0A6I8VZ44_DROPS|nr:protein phosphatase inhibitor 2-like [Drosophila pseudoobscura]